MDAHIHVTKELLPYLQGVSCIANADSPEEYAFLKEVRTSGMRISAGVHPWKADITEWECMEPVLKDADVIGEIGLDCVWCSVDMEIQRSVFQRQLELAHLWHKPVILHTKGMERDVLEMIRTIPNRYLIHWYSCKDWLSEYIALGCWFTVGPDVQWNPVVERLAKIIPEDKLLIESDGLDGLSWGQGRTLHPCDYPDAMRKYLEYIAELRNLGHLELAERIFGNQNQFLRSI